MINYQRLIESGVAQWNQWRIQHPNKWPDLRGVDLSHSYLFEINLMGSNLSGADLRRACLIGSDLSRADLSGADLSGAYLSEASLREANLRNANLTDAQMANVDLMRANLTGTCLASGQKTLAPPARLADAERPTLPPLAQLPDAQSPNLQPPEPPFRTMHTVVPHQPGVFFGAPTFSDKVTTPPQRQASAAHAVWTPQLLEQCQHKLSDYYIGPMTTLILNDIVNVHRPQTLGQFIDLVAAHIPDPQDALRFKSSFPQNSRNTLSRTSTPSTTGMAASSGSKPPSSQVVRLTEACIEKCRQQLTEYYIVPMAHMLVDEIMSTHHPKTNRQLVELIAAQLPDDQVEIFSRQVLS